jgi:UDP-N-acetylmuramoyl-tripeptide--D-alanyl-D-alanine ligase
MRGILEHFVRVYFRKNNPVLVAVVGSVGKTSLKSALGTILSESFRVRTSVGNQNDSLLVPFGILGVKYPENRKELHSVFMWIGILREFWRVAHSKDNIQIIVQELATDHVGDIAHFGKYLRADIAVVTAITPEHMEYFEDLDAVAHEELEIFRFARKVVVNTDDVDGKYLAGLDFVPYAQAKIENPRILGEHSLKSVRGAMTVAKILDMKDGKIRDGVAKIEAVNGRMKLLDGVREMEIIDDTYNSSPEAVRAALLTLYDFKAPSRIAVLGNMNELGEKSGEYHCGIAEFLDRSKLDFLIILGKDIERYLAPKAREILGSKKVMVVKNPLQAADEVLRVAKDGAVVLLKGSQNGVFLEEAVKRLLKNPKDAEKLVRQSRDWMREKGKALL